MDPIIRVTLISGMWWMLPLLASTCVAHREGLMRGYWARESRIGMKVKGACARFKMLGEARKVQGMVADYLLRVFPPTKANFDTPIIGLIKSTSDMFRCAKIMRGWTRDLNQVIHMLRGNNYNMAFYIVQLACILVHCGLDDTMMFLMLEAHCDILIGNAWFRPTFKFTFKQMLQQVLDHPQLSQRILTTFDSFATIHDDHLTLASPLFKHFQDICGNDCAPLATFMNRIPRCISGCLAYLIIFNRAYKAKIHGVPVDNVGTMVACFESYIQLGHNAPIGKWVMEKVDHEERLVYVDE